VCTFVSSCVVHRLLTLLLSILVLVKSCSPPLHTPHPRRFCFCSGSDIRESGEVGVEGICAVQESELGSKFPFVQDEFYEMWGTASRFGYVYLGNNQVYWYTRFGRSHVQPDVKSWKTIVEPIFSKYSPHVNELIQRTNDDDMYLRVSRDRVPIDKWGWKQYSATLIGQALHPSTDNMFQNVAMGMEDALALSYAMASTENPEAAILAYKAMRAERTASVTKNSWAQGGLAMLSNPLAVKFRDFVTSFTPSKFDDASTAHLLSYDLMAELRKQSI
jgi:2-polyprenyl-6-methoxyphenol hydroxylase-like FAD-dependent oxidoreductase